MTLEDYGQSNLACVTFIWVTRVLKFASHISSRVVRIFIMGKSLSHLNICGIHCPQDEREVQGYPQFHKRFQFKSGCVLSIWTALSVKHQQIWASHVQLTDFVFGEAHERLYCCHLQLLFSFTNRLTKVVNLKLKQLEHCHIAEAQVEP